MVVKEQDVSAVRSAITREANVFALIENMTVEQLEKVNDVMGRYRGLSDYVIKSMIQNDPDITQLEVQHLIVSCLQPLLATAYNPC